MRGAWLYHPVISWQNKKFTQLAISYASYVKAWSAPVMFFQSNEKKEKQKTRVAMWAQLPIRSVCVNNTQAHAAAGSLILYNVYTVHRKPTSAFVKRKAVTPFANCVVFDFRGGTTVKSIYTTNMINSLRAQHSEQHQGFLGAKASTEIAQVPSLKKTLKKAVKFFSLVISVQFPFHLLGLF